MKSIGKGNIFHILGLMLMQILPDMQNHAHEDLAHVECQQKSEEKMI